MWEKFLKWEQKVFSAPYKWLITKGYIAIKKVYLSMEDLYEKTIYDEQYKGNPNWAGDD